MTGTLSVLRPKGGGLYGSSRFAYPFIHPRTCGPLPTLAIVNNAATTECGNWEGLHGGIWQVPSSVTFSALSPKKGVVSSELEVELPMTGEG